MPPGYFLQYGSLSRVGIAKKSDKYNKNNDTNNSYTIEWNKWYKSIIAPQRLESIKNSYSELNLLSKTKPSDFIFDFDKAVTGVSHGTGDQTCSCYCKSSDKTFLSFIHHFCSVFRKAIFLV
jgi:hypothetical protein